MGTFSEPETVGYVGFVHADILRRKVYVRAEAPVSRRRAEDFRVLCEHMRHQVGPSTYIHKANMMWSGVRGGSLGASGGYDLPTFVRRLMPLNLREISRTREKPDYWPDREDRLLLGELAHSYYIADGHRTVSKAVRNHREEILWWSSEDNRLGGFS